MQAVIGSLLTLINWAVTGRFYGVLTFVYGLILFFPVLAVTIRRLHDTGRSGLWPLVLFIPLIGGIVFIVFMMNDSQPGPNKYGPNPKGIGNGLDPCEGIRSQML